MRGTAEEQVWYALASVTPLQHPSNVKVVIEIMLSKKEREKLKLGESREEYRSLFQQAAEAIFLFDPETKLVLKANQAFLNLLGYAAGEVPALLIYEFISNDRKKIETDTQQILASGADITAEQVWRRKDGTLIEVQVTMSRIQHGKRAMVFVMASEDK
jgi:PAS domain S-box-containing protein